LHQRLKITNSVIMNYLFIAIFSIISIVRAWVPPPTITSSASEVMHRKFTNSPTFHEMSKSNLHGENSCFMPIRQLDQDYFAPRILQIAGTYPGITRKEYDAVSSEPSPIPGQWSYDFSDPDGPQMGTVAIDGSDGLTTCEDLIAIIVSHFSLKVPLPEVLKDSIDLVAAVDRSKNTFAERKFLVMDTPGKGLSIGAFPSYSEFPEGVSIIGRVELVQIPWLPSMKSASSGFAEEGDLF